MKSTIHLVYDQADIQTICGRLIPLANSHYIITEDKAKASCKNCLKALAKDERRRPEDIITADV